MSANAPGCPQDRGRRSRQRELLANLQRLVVDLRRQPVDQWADVTRVPRLQRDRPQRVTRVHDPYTASPRAGSGAVPPPVPAPRSGRPGRHPRQRRRRGRAPRGAGAGTPPRCAAGPPAGGAAGPPPGWEAGISSGSGGMAARAGPGRERRRQPWRAPLGSMDGSRRRTYVRPLLQQTRVRLSSPDTNRCLHPGATVNYREKDRGSGDRHEGGRRDVRWEGRP